MPHNAVIRHLILGKLLAMHTTANNGFVQLDQNKRRVHSWQSVLMQLQTVKSDLSGDL